MNMYVYMYILYLVCVLLFGVINAMGVNLSCIMSASFLHVTYSVF